MRFCPRIGHAAYWLLALLLFGSQALAVQVFDLYRATTIVTGTEEPERTRGMQEGLRQVVTRLTGDARLADDPRLELWLSRPHRLVTGFTYEDRMKGLPVNDEQGTRQRPFFLRMQFDAAAIDQLLDQLGWQRWSADRPRLSVWLRIDTAASNHILTLDGAHGYGQRMVLEDTAWRLGIPLRLPTVGETVDAFAPAGDDEAPLLTGAHRLTSDGYWNAEWSLRWRERTAVWADEHVTFDVAIKSAMQRAALFLSEQDRLDKKTGGQH